MLFAFFILLLVAVAVQAMPPISVVASVRGKKYDIEAETVEEFTKKVEAAANLEADQQSVLFRGKVLSGTDVLSNVGVNKGDVLMVVKGKRQRPKPELDMDTPGADADFASMTDEQYRKFADENPDVMAKAQEQMDNMLDSNAIDELLESEEKLEEARQNVLANLDEYDKMMPGFKEQASAIAGDPAKWREAMMQAKEQVDMLRKRRDDSRSGRGSTAPFPPASGVDDVADE
jgi:uncharacterized ubiquitin-like protein YukD